MRVLYSFFIRLYGFTVLFVSFLNTKAEKWRKNRKKWELALFDKIYVHRACCWIHCASAGEFEQAIPLIKNLRKQNADLRIAVSFFSSSGFEMYSNSGWADLFFYFPLDTKKNAGKLTDILKPDFVIFIRNEIWWNILAVLKEKHIPTYLVNANLEQGRNFLYQQYLNKTYTLFTKIFDTKTYGNTKLEKVIENKKESFEDKILDDFCKDSFVLILGSSWKIEEKIVADFYNRNKGKIQSLKIIIAPHEFNDNKAKELQTEFGENISTYTQYLADNKKWPILFLDKKGILKYAYRYAHIAFIGGGFNKTVHNVSEAAVYGVPTIFGPYYHKFEEINELVNLQVAFSVNDGESFEKKLMELINDNELQKSIKEKLQAYFSPQENVSAKIINEIVK
ncbi:MAG TPA: glycosyltransferase N-terminal domain-containing protein [Chitinophagales bacterium]|nr:glycosyltransferase N-terminal domain-containing protein [Chitinophagales bacterium]